MEKQLPDMRANPQIEQAAVISLGELAGYVPDQMTHEVVNMILAEMNKLKQ